MEARDLRVYFPVRSGLLRRARGAVHAVDGVTLHVEAGETLGVVGESGCGKTTLARCLAFLLRPTGGSIVYDGVDPWVADKDTRRRIRKEVQIVFQDPYASLNPRMTVKQILTEPMLVTRSVDRTQFHERALELLRRVGLEEQHLYRFPHEFSGGQRQRICIARALATDPRLLILDEPTSSLDVSVQAQILNLLQDLQRDYGLAYVFISHDLGVVKHMSRRVVVMYLGKVVERTDSEALFTRPLHPYTVALMRATPVPDTKATRVVSSIPGEPPNPVEPPAGCRFHPRCPLVMEHCSASEPELREEEGGHWVACHLYPRPAGEQPVWAAMAPEGTPWARSAENAEGEPAAVGTGVRGLPSASSHTTHKDMAE